MKHVHRMKIALLLALALTTLGANAQIAKVLMLNAASMPLKVQGDDRSVATPISPGAGATVVFNRPQWMAYNSKVYRYHTLSVQRLHSKGKKIVLQFGPDAVIYLMPAGTTVPGLPPPPQPKGFPIRPDKATTVR